MRLSRSRRASVAASTSCHTILVSCSFWQEVKQREKTEKLKNVQSLTARKAARLLSASSFWSISSCSLQEAVIKTITQRIHTLQMYLMKNVYINNTWANILCDCGFEKEKKKLLAACLIFFFSEQMLSLLTNPEQSLAKMEQSRWSWKQKSVWQLMFYDLEIAAVRGCKRKLDSSWFCSVSHWNVSTASIIFWLLLPPFSFPSSSTYSSSWICANLQTVTKVAIQWTRFSFYRRGRTFASQVPPAVELGRDACSHP